MTDTVLVAIVNVVGLVVLRVLSWRDHRAVVEKVDGATDAAHAAYKEANDVNQKIAQVGMRRKRRPKPEDGSE